MAIRRAVNSAIKAGTTSLQFKEGTRPDQFSVARSRRSRRPIVIPNPIAQLLLANLIANNWRRIERHISKSKISLSKPLLSSEHGRAITITPHQELYEERLRHASTSRYALLSDISQFFPTLYTHSIAWAIHGKKKAKEKRNSQRPLGNRLDVAVRRCQHQQTIGIPIGPDTSHVLAELVGSSIDVLLNEQFEGGVRGYRHVDDFALFFDSLGTAERALTALESSVRAFELKLNPLKTKIVPIEEILEDSWSHELQNFTFSPVTLVQRRQLHYFFEVAHRIYTSQRDEAVIRFALGRLSAIVIKKQNWNVLQTHLLRCVLGFPSTLQEVGLLFFTYEKLGYAPDLARLDVALNLIVTEHLPLQHHSEVAWALWLALHFNIKISCPLGRTDVRNSTSTTLLLLLALRDKKLLTAKLDKRWLRPFARSDLLYDEGWLFTYEAARRNWLPKIQGKDVVKSDTFFAILSKNDVTFFDTTQLPTPVFEPKANFS